MKFVGSLAKFTGQSKLVHAHDMKAHMENTSIAPLILNLVTR